MAAKLAIGTVHPDFIDARFCQCLTATLEEDYRGYLPLRGRVLMARAPAGMLHVARNQVVRDFLAHPLKPQYLVFIDTDMEWTPEQVWQLVDSAESNQLPILNALVCMQGGIDASEKIPVMYDYNFNVVQPKEDLQRVFCGGSAFMAIRRDVFQVVAASHPWPTPWFNYEHRNGKAVTEEIVFAQRCWDLNIQIHVDTRIVVGHRKIHAFSMATSPHGSRVGGLERERAPAS